MRFEFAEASRRLGFGGANGCLGDSELRLFTVECAEMAVQVEAPEVIYIRSHSLAYRHNWRF